MTLTQRWWILLGLFSFLSSAALIAAGYHYAPLTVDGGWASYSGFAISQGREPYLHQGTLADAADVPGVKSLFLFDTSSNTRALYTSAWFRIVGPSWRSLKALSVVEYAVLVLVAFMFFRRLMPSRDLALLATILLATDKILVVMAASTFRPDVIQAAVGCAFYLVLRSARRTVTSTLGVSVFAALAGMMSATAVIPIGIAAVFRATELVVDDGLDRVYRRVQLGVAVGVAASTYLFRKAIVSALLNAQRDPSEPIEAVERIGEVWSGGLPMLLQKEADRLDAYFLLSNAPLLVALLLAGAVWFLPSPSRRTAFRESASVWAGVVTTVFIIAIIDPHPRPQHLVTAMPFLLLLLGRVDGLPVKVRRGAVGALTLLAVGSSLLGFALAGRMVSDARAVGFSNAWLEDTLSELTRAGDPLVVAGGTEYWPYWDQQADVTMIDLTRSEGTIELLAPALGQLEYAVLSGDYEPATWIAGVREVFGIELRVLVDKQPYVLIADGFGGGTR